MTGKTPTKVADGGERRPSLPVCRVCRQGALDGSPLFYPCQCSGSIKYVHQECLVQWLKLSKKSQCELCHHKFSFTPIYRQGAPRRLSVCEQLAALGSKLLRGLALTARWLLRSLSVLSVLLLWFLALPLLVGYVAEFYLLPLMPRVRFSEDWTLRLCACFFAGLYLCALTGFVGVGLASLRDRALLLLREHSSKQSAKYGNGKRTAKRRPREAVVRSGVATLDSSGDQPPLDSLTDAVPTTPSLLTDGVRPAIISRRRAENQAGNNGTLNKGTTINSNNVINNNGNRQRRADNVSEAGSSTTNGRWIQQVTNREYRAFLRRRELVRQRERLQFETQLSTDYDVEHYKLPSPNDYDYDNSHDNGNANNTDGDAWEDQPQVQAQVQMGEDEGVSVVSGGAGSWLSRTSAHLRHRRPPVPEVTPPDANAYRCRVCQGRYCLDRSHVVQASQANFVAPKPSNNGNSQETLGGDDDDDDVHVDDASSTMIPLMVTKSNEGLQDPQLEMLEMWPRETMFQDIWLFPPVDGDLVAWWLRSLLGFGRAVAFSLLIGHLLAFAPLLLGTAVWNGTLWTMARWAVDLVFASAIDNVRHALARVGFYLAVPAPLLLPVRVLVEYYGPNPMVRLMTGHAVIYAVSQYLTTVASMPRKVRQYAYLTALTVKLLGLLVLRYVAVPTLLGCQLLRHLLALSPEEDLGDFFPQSAYLYAPLGFLLGSLLVTPVQRRWLRSVTGKCRPGLLFFANRFLAPSLPLLSGVGGGVQQSRHEGSTTRTMLQRQEGFFVGECQRVLVHGWQWNVARILGQLAAQWALLELAVGSSLTLQAPIFHRQLSFGHQLSHHRQLPDQPSMTKMMTGMLEAFARWTHRGVLFWGLPSCTDVLLMALIRLLRMRSFTYGGRFVEDERGEGVGSRPTLSVGRWRFVPDDGEQDYGWWRVMRIFRHARVQPVDIAKLPVRNGAPSPQNSIDDVGADSRDDNMTMTMMPSSGSRYKGYTVVYCPPWMAARLAVLVATALLLANAWTWLALTIPLVLGHRLYPLLFLLNVRVEKLAIILSPYELGCLLVLLAKGLLLHCMHPAPPRRPSSTASVPVLMQRLFGERGTLRARASMTMAWMAALLAGALLLPAIGALYLLALMAPALLATTTAGHEFGVPLMVAGYAFSTLGVLLLLLGCTTLDEQSNPDAAMLPALQVWRLGLRWDTYRRSRNVATELNRFLQKAVWPLLGPATTGLLLPPLLCTLTVPFLFSLRSSPPHYDPELMMRATLHWQPWSFAVFLAMRLALGLTMGAWRYHQTVLVPRLRDERYLERVQLNNLLPTLEHDDRLNKHVAREKELVVANNIKTQAAAATTPLMLPSWLLYPPPKKAVVA